MASGSLKPRSKLDISWNSLTKLRISQNTKWADKNSSENSYVWRIAWYYKNILQCIQLFVVFHSLLMQLYSDWLQHGIFMVYLTFVSNTNNWWHSSLARKRRLKSIFSFLQVCFLLFQIQRIINERLWDKYVYRRRELTAWFHKKPLIIYLFHSDVWV